MESYSPLPFMVFRTKKKVSLRALVNNAYGCAHKLPVGQGNDKIPTPVFWGLATER